LPLIKRRMKGIWLLESADLGVCDYSSPVIEPSSLDLLDGQRDLHADIAKTVGRFDILRLKAIRDGSQALWGLFFKGQAVQLDFSSHEALLDKPFDEWRTENFDKKHRSNLNYKMRRFHKKHTEITFEIVPDDQVGSVIDHIQHLRVGRFEGDPIQQTSTLKFYRDVAIKGQVGQFSKTHQLMADGKFVGAMFGLTYNGRHHGMLMACDYETYGEFAPAFNMIDMLMARWQK
jgi:CelD/BcsL family acetyltransferase involved in cellulose biosynthesis